jgi:hypothetical protein
MAQYNDILVRDNLQDTGQIPCSGGMTHSPDIIPQGTSPMSDPTVLIKEDWIKDVGQNLATERTNYIYMRGINLASGATEGEFHLYYAPAALLLFPDQWQNNFLKTSDGSSSVTVTPKAKDEKVVGFDPFTWAPVPPPPGSSHYCMIGRVVTTAHPNPIPKTGDIDDFAKYISNNGGMCWRNVALVNKDIPTFEKNVKYDQGPTGALIHFLLSCKNVPVGAAVAFSCGTPGPQPPINLNKTTITNPYSQDVGMATNVPDNFSSYITYQYWSMGTKPPPGWEIKLQAIYIVPADHKLYDIAQPLESFKIPADQIAKIGPQKGIRVGAHTTQGS